MSTPLTEDELIELASLIEMTSSQFKDIHDPLADANGGIGSMTLRVIEKHEQEFFPALQQAQTHGWLDKLVSQILQAGGLERLSASLDNNGVMKVKLQGLLQPELGIPDSHNYNAAYLRAQKRVCRIEVKLPGKAPVVGTGFLVGHQAILTNWHVVKDLIDVTAGSVSDAQIAGSRDRLNIQFDFYGTATPKKVNAAEDWLIDFSPVHQSEDPHGTTHGVDDNLSSFADPLDYALIRLAVPIGRERSSYNLHPPITACIDFPGNAVTLYQHPKGNRLSHADGFADSLWPENIETRLRHTANSMQGSSGGVLLNSDWIPVGLHQSEVILPGGTKINSAIPTCKIADRIPLEELAAKVEPLLVTASGYAVIAQDDLQERLLDTANGSALVLCLPDEPRPDVLGDLMATMFDPASNKFVALEARHTPSDPRKFACQVIDGLFPVGTGESILPDPGEGKTAEAGWVRDVLMPKMIEKLAEIPKSQAIWISIAGMDEKRLIGRPAGLVLEQLLARMASLPQLRLLLIGHVGIVPSLTPGKVLRREARSLNKRDYVSYLMRYMVRGGITHFTQDEIQLVVEAMADFIDYSDEEEWLLKLPGRAKKIVEKKRG